MQNEGEKTDADTTSELKNVEIGKASLAPSLLSAQDVEKAEMLANIQHNFINDLSGSDDDDISEVESFIMEQELEDEESGILDASKFLLPESAEGSDLPTVDPETQARLEALLEAAGIGKLSTADGKAFADPEVLRRLTSSVSCALDEAAAALTRMRAEQQGQIGQGDGGRSLAEACSDGDIGTVRKLLDEGRSVHETTEEGESLLSLACSAGYYELAQVLLAMRANVEDRGIKGDCTPLMEAASGGYVDIVKLLVAHGADVNAQSSAGNTPLHYAACGGYEDVVQVLIDARANVEVHNENGHTPLMEAASAGHVGVAMILLQAGAGINTHSNEFKESALTLACYKGHLEMVKFLLEAGADQEHKTDEMHTALMEASMDGHVEVARLLLDSGAQVNMPADSFESPLTLAACGGHVELANLLIERGANLEEVNDEGYTPLMEAAREGHEEMVALLLTHGADINTQTEETQETALTLACCGGFLEVADFLIKAGADIELGCSTPLMEASQEGHLELVKYLLRSAANVHAQTGTGDTALTYACENGHTDVADVLLQSGAELEHESEGGRTPLMKAARAGHLCTVQFLIGKGADVNRQTSTNDHTVLSLAAAGGHLAVVELLLAHCADPTHKLKDGSTVLIEASKGGHTNVVNLLLDFPTAPNCSNSPTELSQSPDTHLNDLPRVPMAGLNNVVPPQDPEQAKLDFAHLDANSGDIPVPGEINLKNLNLAGRTPAQIRANMQLSLSKNKKGGQQIQSPMQGDSSSSNQGDSEEEFGYDYEKNYTETGETSDDLDLEEQTDLKPSERLEAFINKMMQKAELLNTTREEQILKKQQILDELQKVEEELQEKAQSQLLLNSQQKLELEVQQLQQEELERQRQIQHKQHQQLLQQKEQYQRRLQQLQQQYQQKLQQHQLQQQLQQQLQAQLQEEIKREQQKQQELRLSHEIEKEPAPQPPPLALQQLQQQLQAQLQEELKIEQQKQQALLLKQEHEARMRDNQPAQQQKPPHSPLPLHIALQSQLEAKMEASKKGKEPGNQENQSIEEDNINVDHSSLHRPCGDGKESEDNPDQNIPYPSSPNEDTKKPPPRKASEVLPSANIAVPEDFDQAEIMMPTLDQIPLPDDPVSNTDEDEEDVEPTAAPPSTPAEEADENVKGDQPDLEPVPPGLPPLDNQQLLQQQQIFNQYTEALNAYSKHMSPEDQLKARKLLHKQLQQLQLQQKQANLQNIQKKNKKLKQQQQQLLMQQQQLLQQNQQLTNEYNAISAVAGQTVDDSTPPDSTPITPNPSPASPQITGPVYPVIDLDAQTESNHDTALTLACAGGHAELVSLLLSRGADIEHRDKKGFTPLILAATAGHSDIVEILLNHGADIEAQSERTKDTPLSLACSGGRYEVVDLLLGRGANKEHRNVSDYTPLSLAASGGYVNIIKLLLSHGAEINSRTGSKLGISPLMLAAMNGHTAAVKLLLDMGSDINAQIETNRNTALTLACFQGRHEVVSLLVDRKANIEHRAKTGLTPLMEAASGGYVEVGRVLLDKGADVNAPPVPSSRDTALTIAADKGHYRFVELLLSRGAAVDVKNKKGNSPLWLSCNGGHLDVVQLLVSAGADIDSQDNRKVSCLMSAFRKGHVKVVKWMVRHVNQFPSDQECMRYIATITDKELLKKCHQCMEIIVSAKDRQAAEANKHATILLEELDMEKSREESKKAAAARKREKRKKKKKEKQEKEKEATTSSKNSTPEPEDEEDNMKIEKDEGKSPIKQQHEEPVPRIPLEPPSATTTSTMGTTIPTESSKNRRNKNKAETNTTDSLEMTRNKNKKNRHQGDNLRESSVKVSVKVSSNNTPLSNISSNTSVGGGNNTSTKKKKGIIGPISTTGIGDLDDFGVLPDDINLPPAPTLKKERSNKSSSGSASRVSALDTFDSPPVTSVLSPSKSSSNNNNTGNILLTPNKATGSSPKKGGKREEGWKEVIRKSKKVAVPATAISRVIGRGGCNINAIREVSGANIEVDKQKGTSERTITIKGSADATRQAYNLITALIKDPDKDLVEILPKFKPKPAQATSCSYFAIPTTSVVTTSVSMLTAVNGPTQAPGKVKLIGQSSTDIIRPSGTGQAWAPVNVKASPKRSGMVSKAPGSSTCVTSVTGGVIVTSSVTPTKSPNAVARKLFQMDPSLAGKVTNAGTKQGSNVNKQLPPRMMAQQAKLMMSSQMVNPAQPPKQEPQPPLPMRNGLTSSAGTVPTSQTNPPVSTPGQYSPFNNLFSQLQMTEQVLRKKDDNFGMNFATAAAQGVLSSLAPMGSIGVSTSPTPKQEDPGLQAKAPGYKPNGQRNMSPQINENGPLKSPDFMSNFPLPSGMSIPNPVPVYPNQSDINRVPGFHMVSTSQTSPPHPRSGPGTPSKLSPRSLSDMVGRIEYSTPDQPMTLPKIESTLNPNAPDFTCRQNSLPGGSENRRHAAVPAGGPQSAFRPPMQGFMHNQTSFNRMSPSTAFLHHPNSVVTSEFGPSGTTSSFGASGFPTGQAPGMPRQFSPLPRSQTPVRPASASSSVTSPREEPDPLVSDVQNSHTPSPTTDQMATDDRKSGFPRPIGTERTRRTPTSAGAPTFPVPDLSSIWSFGSSEMNTDWMGIDSTSVITSSVVTTSVMSHSLSSKPDDPSQNPQGIPMPGYGDSTVVDAGFSNSSSLLNNPSGPFPGYLGGLPGQMTLQSTFVGSGTGSGTGDGNASMWNQPMKTSGSDGGDPKLIWNNWAQT